MPPARPSRRKVIVLIIFALFFAPILARAALYAIGNAPRAYYQADWSSSGCCRRRATTSRRVSSCSPAPPAPGRASSRCIAGSSSSPPTRDAWTRYDVVGWGSPVRVNGWPPDGRWYSNTPVAIADISGLQAEELIPKIEAAVRAYEFARAGDYRIWPGPNSNSFTAAILRAVPELGVSLPPNAVGRDYRAGFYAGRTDSGTGLELNLQRPGRIQGRLGRGHRGRPAWSGRGARPAPPGLKLPGYGRIGLESPVATALAR